MAGIDTGAVPSQAADQDWGAYRLPPVSCDWLGRDPGSSATADNSARSDFTRASQRGADAEAAAIKAVRQGVFWLGCLIGIGAVALAIIAINLANWVLNK